MVSGIWANSNYDAQKEGQAAPREKILADIEERFGHAIGTILGETDGMKDEIDHDDPFFAAMRVPEIDFGEDAEEIARKRENAAALGYAPDYDQL